MPRPRIVLRATAALVALLLMAMSCDPYYDLHVSGQNGRVTVDDGPTQALPVQSRVLAGTTVRLAPVPDAGFEFVRWEGDATGSQSPLTIELVRDTAVEAVFAPADTPPEAPPNDDFVNAAALLGDTGLLEASNVGASKEDGEPDHAGRPGGASVWWRFDADQDGTLTIDTNGSAIDTLLAVYTGSTLAGLTQVASDADGGSGGARTVSFAVTAGAVYQVAVDSTDGSTGPIRLGWSFDPGLVPGPEPEPEPSPLAILRIDVTPDDAGWTVRNDATDGSVVASGSGDDVLDVAPGTYHLTASRSLYADATDLVTLAHGDDVTVALQLTRQYQLDLQGSDGGVLVDGAPHDLPFQGTYLAGTTVQLRADPDPGYAFASWSGSLSSDANPLAVTMDDDVALAASFVDAAPPRITILEPADGHVTTASEIEVTGTASDDETTVETVESGLASGAWNACERMTSADFRCLVTNLAPDVTSLVEVRAVDAQGNEAVASVTVRYEPASAPPEFDIEIVYFDETFSASQKAVFATAVSRWQTVVVGDLQDARIQRSVSGSCGRGEPALDTTVDDLLIFATSFTDAPGGVLGSAGPCVLRSSGDDAGTVVVGFMEFDTADLDNLETNGQLEDVIVHEMGHVLGLGTLWEYRSLLDYVASDGSTTCRDAADFGVDPTYLGPSGVATWQEQLGGSGYVPVEEGGGPGTRCGHWDESTFGTELMTGYLNASDQPLSVLSVRSLEDLGLTVDPASADPYVRPGAGALRTQSLFDIAEAETILMPIGTVDPETGRFEPLR